MIKVALTYIAYPVSMARYFHEALLRREDVELWVAGPFSGRSIPWKGGMLLPAEYVREPDLCLPMGQGPLMNYSFVESQAPWQPDLWMEVNAGLMVTDRPRAGKFAVVATDPHVLTHYDQRRSVADAFFCMQQPYMQPDDFWLPYAYDPVWHTPTQVPWDERQYDCSLVGLQYPTRAQFSQNLGTNGHSYYFDTGPAYEDARAIYHQSRTGLNWSSKADTTARVFELMAFGIVPILNRVPDLGQLFTEGEHYLGFSNMGEALSKFSWAMDHPEEAQEIARAGREAVEPHTWDARVDQILDDLGFGQDDHAG